MSHRIALACAAFALATASPALAQAPAQAPAQPQAPSKTKPAPAAKPGAPSGTAAQAGSGAGEADDPVIATVDGDPIHASDVQAAKKNLPAQFTEMPRPVLENLVVDQLIDQKALVQQARREHLDADPTVRRSVVAAEDRALQQALIQKEVGPVVTDEAIRKRYDETIAGKPGAEEVHASHILVGSEAEAKAIIAQIEKGSDFSDLAKKDSKDPGAANGGDLGWFTKGDMVPAFSAAAFALKPGEYTKAPVQTQFGWHVIKVFETRQAPPESFEQAHDKLRQKMIQDGVQDAIKKARAEAKIVRLTPEPPPAAATDSAEPGQPEPPQPEPPPSAPK